PRWENDPEKLGAAPDSVRVVENMDAYCDEGMGEVIVGEPFCKASYVEARRFDVGLNLLLILVIFLLLAFGVDAVEEIKEKH
nr:hypothetical protein [Tanacetum cinerariifolium]